MNEAAQMINERMKGRKMRFLRSVLTAGLVSLLFGGGGGLHAQDKFGFGIIIGEPTGLAWKYNINHINAIDGAIGFSPYDRFRIHADYLWHAHPFDEDHLALHYGLGAAFGFGRTDYFVAQRGSYVLHNGDLGFGARVVVGLTYMIPRSPVDLFFEVAPVIVAAPGPGFGFDLGLGARVYP